MKKVYEYEPLLKSHSITPTAVRLLAIQAISEMDTAFSFEDLYHYMKTAERSTVFRTVNLFEQQGLLHGFDDGMGKRKYCLCCEAGCHQATHQHCRHVHITCRQCGRTFCLHEEHLPHIHAPQGFRVENIECVITGLCNECSEQER